MKPDQHDRYILGRSESETRRLIIQDQIYRPITRRTFEAAGIGRGMTVLDIGSGAGDVALLLADMVGPTGRVLGVDMNPAILETARERVAAAGWRNVRFIAGDLDTLELEWGFDAVVGRWILMYLSDPVALVRRVAALLRPGGIVAFNEMDLAHPPGTLPPTPLGADIQRLMVPPPGAPGPDTRIGAKLFRIFLEAGLPAPDLRLEAPIGGAPDWPGYEYIAETLRSLLPGIAAATGIDPASVGVDTLAERLRNEVVAANAVQMLPMIVGAWSRLR